MKKSILLVLSLSWLLALSACNNDNDLVQTPQKEGAIETILSCEHKEGYDVLTTTHKIWVKNQIFNTITHHDTLPTLGETTVEGEDAEGYGHRVQIPKEYEFYITVQ